MIKSKALYKKEQEDINDKLVTNKESTNEKIGRTKNIPSRFDLSQSTISNENYINSIAPALIAFSKTFKNYNEMSKKISENLIQPIIVLQNEIAKITNTFNDFLKYIPEIFEPLSKFSRQIKAIDKLGENQLIWIKTLDEELVDNLLATTLSEKVITDYLDSTNYLEINNTINISRKSNFLTESKIIYSQSISAYQKQLYHLSCIGMISIIDFLLSEISGESGTKFSNKVNLVLKKINREEILENNEIRYFYIFLSIEKTLNTLFEYSDFTKTEPVNLNRHWIAHGRTNRKYCKLDCIKLINLIYALLLIRSI